MPDAAANLALTLLILAAARALVVGGTLVGLGGAAFFYPMWSHLGESLRKGDVPGWNPYVFSGAPFAADPQSGWMYMPAMVLFTLLPLETAVKGWILAHLLLAGLGMYALARVLGMGVTGAGVSAVAYGLSVFVYERTACCPGYPGVVAWLPLLILPAELALRSSGQTERLLWCAASGFALSQVLGAWLGQGSLYALLLLGGYVGYRGLLATQQPGGHAGAHVATTALVGGAVLLFGFGLAAAGVLPRLEYNGFSNLAGGYTDKPAGIVTSVRPERWRTLAGYSRWYAGLTTLALACLAPLVARAKLAIPYWALAGVSSLVLAGPWQTPLHSLLNLLPGFARLHPHNPERVLMVAYFCAALLAGATAHCLRERARTPFLALAPAGGLLALGAADALVPELSVPLPACVALSLTGGLLAAHRRLPRWRPLLPALLLLVVAFDVLVAGHAVVSAERQLGTRDRLLVLGKPDLASYYSPTGAGHFLRARLGAGEQFRYFGYDPLVRGEYVPYTMRYLEREAAALETNNRAIVLGLPDLQGHNPIHLRRYDEYVAALNGRAQDYHDAFVFESGLSSPLLDLLGARYIVVPSSIPPDRDDLERLVAEYPTVYRDAESRVLENPRALPRAWLVHSARRVDPGAALPLLVSGEVDPRRTALLEAPLPPLAKPPGGATERTEITSYEPDKISMRVSAAALALLMLSEVYYPAWKAYVDGAPAPVYLADHILRAVPVPEGQHTVELRFESGALRSGMLISTATALFILALVGMATFRRLSLGELRQRTWRG
jgi:hypothetical protein